MAKQSEPEVFNSTDKYMAGAELRRLRTEAGLSQEQLAKKMVRWGWYRRKVERFEASDKFYLDEKEMQILISVLLRE